MFVVGADAIERDLRTYIPLVHLWARRLASRLPASIEVDDLVQVGTLAVYNGLKTADDKDGRLLAYLHARAYGAFMDLLRADDLLPQHARKKVKTLEAEVHKFYATHGRPPSVEELAQRLGDTTERVRATLQEASLRYVYSADEGAEESHHVEYEESAEETVDRLQQLALGQQAIDSLDERRKYIAQRILAGDAMVEIAAALGVDASYVSQLLHSITVDIQKFIKAKNHQRTYAAPIQVEEPVRADFRDTDDLAAWAEANLKGFNLRALFHGNGER